SQRDRISRCIDRNVSHPQRSLRCDSRPRMTMELSMTIAIGAALAIGQFFTALVIILFVLIAEVLEGMTVGRGRRAIKDLLDFLPRNANVRRNGRSREVAATEIRFGDIVLVKPGSRIAVDGEVIGGNSFVDQERMLHGGAEVGRLLGLLFAVMRRLRAIT